MKKKPQLPPSSNANNDNVQLARMNREAWKRVIDPADSEEKEALSITMGVSMESDPKQEQALTHYQYGALFHSLVNNITTLNPAPKKFIVVIADYLHRHNVKIKALLELFDQKRSDFKEKKPPNEDKNPPDFKQEQAEIVGHQKDLLNYVIASAQNELMGIDETQSALSEVKKTLVTEAEKQAEAEAIRMGQFWLEHHTEEASAVLQKHHITYERHMWKEWYDSTDEEYSARVNIPLIKALYHTDSKFQAHIDTLANDFLSRIYWLPKKEEFFSLQEKLNAIQNLSVTGNEATLATLHVLTKQFGQYLNSKSVTYIEKLCKKEVFTEKEQLEIQSIIGLVLKNVSKDLLHNQYRLLLGVESVNTLKTIVRLKDNQIKLQDTKEDSQVKYGDLSKIQIITHNLIELLIPTQVAIIEASKIYLIEEAAASKWFASLSPFSILTYKDRMTPAFAYALDYFKVQAQLPFVPYNLTKRIKPTHVEQSELTPEQMQALKAAKPKAIDTQTASTDSESGITAQNKKDKNFAFKHDPMASPSILTQSLEAAIISDQANSQTASTYSSEATAVGQDSVRRENKSPSPDYRGIKGILGEGLTFDKAINPIKTFINQEMETLKDAEDKEQAQRACSILDLVVTHKNTSDELISAVTYHLISKNFIKDPTQNLGASATDHKVAIVNSEATSTARENHSKTTTHHSSTAVPIRQSNDYQPTAGHKRGNSTFSPPHSNPSPTSRLRDWHHFFKGRRQTTNKAHRSTLQQPSMNPVRHSHSSDEYRACTLGA